MPKTVKALGAGLLLMLSLAGARSAPEWTVASPPPGTVALPAIATPDLLTDGEQVKVCVQAGMRPRTYPVISRQCWAGAPTCTVFVGFPREDVIRLQEYDLANPPVVVATDDVCTQPSHPANGVLGRTPPQR